MRTSPIWRVLTTVMVANAQLLLPKVPPAVKVPAASDLSSLARDVQRVESVREVKDVTSTFAQLAQFGHWPEMARLFTSDGTLQWDKTAVKGPSEIESWLGTDARDMDGIKPGSLDTMVMSNPLINLAVDGQTAKARFNGWRFQGDGAGGTRMQGGIYENEYAMVNGQWKISLLHYYALYNGTYAQGWRNAGGVNILNVPFHYTPDESGIPIPPPVGAAPQTNTTLSNLARRITVLNDEDEVQSLQHAYGYYVDRRMWMDVVDLFATNSTVKIDNFGTFSGASGVRQALEKWMGPEGLSQGVLNEHLIFDTVVNIHPVSASGIQEATARGVEIGLLSDSSKNASSWQFNVFSNQFVKENGIWKLKSLNITPLVVATYSAGWGKGSSMPAPTSTPAFLSFARPALGTITAQQSSNESSSSTPAPDLADLQRKLARSAAVHGVENVSNAYGFYIDFIDGVGCGNMAAIHARDGHKESPFAGFYQTRERVLKACTAYYGTSATTSRASISFHWRPQPVISVSADGRSAALRARLLQPQTEKTREGVIRGAMYHDQMVLEDGIWRLWSVTIDEFYWTGSNWKDGWAGVKPRAKDAPNPAPRDLIKQYPPDLTLVQMGDPRETGFMGGAGRYVAWPEIQRMWFAYRNPVSGRVPESYWPGCVPCKNKPEWTLLRHGYQEPPTGPTIVNATAAAAVGANGTVHVTVKVAGGPSEPVTGVVKLENDDLEAAYTLTETNGDEATFALPTGLAKGTYTLTVRYLGSDRLKPGQTTVSVKVQESSKL